MSSTGPGGSLPSLPPDVDPTLLLAPAEAPVEVAPAREPTTPSEWIRDNLFSTWFSGVLTVLVGGILLYVAYRVLWWLFVTADWEVIRANLRLLMVGRFPADELWRVWVAVYLVTGLAGLSWGAVGPRLTWTPKTVALRAALAIALVALLAYLLEGWRVWLLAGGLAALYAMAVWLGRRRPGGTRRAIVVGWLLIFPGIIVLLRGFGGVAPLRWGGFLLNVLVAVVGIVASFPVGILLALGRRSTLPAVSAFTVVVIEFVRGAPLYTWLLFGEFVLPFLLPRGLELASILRAMIVVTVFSSAYVAEIVRGGLQGVHHGQYEAARALGLSTTRTMALIVLPQALRSTIPAMISHFISLFKDTSLLATIGFIDLLSVARIAPQHRFAGDLRQTLVFAAFVFWIVAFSMSRWSQRLERRLGVGER